MKKIGFIGFGAMGSRIVQHFLEAGYTVKGYNRDQSKVTAMDGVESVASPRAAATDVDIVVAMVRDDQASESVWLDSEFGAIHAIKPGTVAVEMSTLSVAHTKSLSRKFKKQDIEFLEAPVVGTRPQAEAKQLTVLAAGSTKGFTKAEPLLQTIAAKVLHLGESGMGASLKLVINTLFGIQTVAFAEMTATLRSNGYSDEKIRAILPELPVTSPIMKMVLGLIMENKFDPLFPIELVEKDFHYGKELIAANGLRPLMTEATQKIFQLALEEGLGNLNITGVAKLYDRGQQSE